MPDAFSTAKGRERLERYTIPEPNSGCLLWFGSLDRGGYGQMSIRGRGKSPLRAHRVAYEIAKGPIPEGMMVLHSCDVRACCNPAHLRVGVSQDNVDDMLARNRISRTHQLRGEMSPRAKLTDGIVSAILADKRNQTDIAASYGISQATVSRIKLRQGWKHVIPDNGIAA